LIKLERKIIKNKFNFEYKPSSIENLFTMDSKTSDIQKLLKQRLVHEL
jgi:hypothetical protein